MLYKGRLPGICTSGAVLAAILFLSAPALAADCVALRSFTKNVADRGKVVMHALGGALLFTSHMHVNADGAPDAYRPDGKGLSYTCDGAVAHDPIRGCVIPSQENPDWQTLCRATFAAAVAQDFAGPAQMCTFGFLAEGGRRKGNFLIGGRPIIQKDGDTAPGGYVSATSLAMPIGTGVEQRHYVNSREVPFIVLSSKDADRFGATLGDVAAVWRQQADALAFAVFADQGPARGLGEGSIALHRALKNNPMIMQRGVERAKRGISDDVRYVVFPGQNSPPQAELAAWKADIDRIGKDAFERWGGLDRLRACSE